MTNLRTPMDLWASGMKFWKMSFDMQIQMAESAFKLANVYSPNTLEMKTRVLKTASPTPKAVTCAPTAVTVPL